MARIIEEQINYYSAVPITWCECCNKPLYDLDPCIVVDGYRDIKKALCINCYHQATKKDIVELLDGRYVAALGNA